MRKYWKKYVSWWDRRKREERYVVLAGACLMLAMVWYQVSYTRLMARQAMLHNKVSITNSQIHEEMNRQSEIQLSLATDPNVFALNRQHDLVKANADTDARLDKLYGELIDPRQMSLMLTRILQRETSLQLVSLENRPSESLMSTDVKTLQTDGEAVTTVQVFRHGLKMVFKGDYLETLRYLKSLEQLDSNFFWESFEYSLDEYPVGKISLEIYTLSTQKGWIGV